MTHWGRCNTCDRPLTEPDRFCTACGAAVTEAVCEQSCPQCGSGYPASYRFCVEDGLALQSELVAAGSPPAFEAFAGPRLVDGSAALDVLRDFWAQNDRLILACLIAAGLACAAIYWLFGPPATQAATYVVALLPALAALIVGLARSEKLSGAVETVADWAYDQTRRSAAHPSRLRRWIVAPVLAAPDAALRLAGERTSRHAINGLFVLFQLYVALIFALVTYFVVLVVVMLVLTVLAILAGLWLLGRMAEEASSTSFSDGGSGRQTTRVKHDFWGEEYQEHTDGSGRKFGESRTREDMWRDRYVETRDRDGRVVERTRERQDFWGDTVQEHRNRHERKVGETRERQDFWGERYEERRDSHGRTESTTRQKVDFWGGRNRERKPRS